MPRRFFVFVLFIVGLVVPTIASAATTAYAGTRVAAFDLAVHVGIGLSVDQASEKHRGIGFTCDEIASGSPHAAEAGGGGMVSLYRAVGDAELGVIESTGRVPASLSGLESKYFSATAEGAASYARQAVRGFGDAPYTLVETQIPRSSLPADVLMQVDRNVPAVVLPNTHLPLLGPAKVWSFMPVP
jgi:hypothetical protein